jgi:hypothetical protein
VQVGPLQTNLWLLQKRTACLAMRDAVSSRRHSGPSSSYCPSVDSLSDRLQHNRVTRVLLAVARAVDPFAGASAGYPRLNLDWNNLQHQGCRHLTNAEMPQLRRLFLSSTHLRLTATGSEARAVTILARPTGWRWKTFTWVFGGRCRRQWHRYGGLSPSF